MCIFGTFIGISITLRNDFHYLKFILKKGGTGCLKILYITKSNCNIICGLPKSQPQYKNNIKHSTTWTTVPNLNRSTKNLDHRNLWTAVPNLNRSTKNLDRNLEPQYQISTKKISTTGIYEPQYQISTAVQKISTTGTYESQYKNNFNRSTIFEPQYQTSTAVPK